MRSNTRAYIKVHALQSLLMAPDIDTIGILIKAHDTLIRADKQTWIITTCHNTLHAIAHKRTVFFGITMIVVISLIVHQQSIMMRTNVYRTIGFLMNCIYLESLQRQCYAILLACPLIITEQSIFSTYPQMIAILSGDKVDTAKHLGMIDLQRTVETYIKELVLTSHPYSTILLIKKHGLYIFLGNDEIGFHKLHLARRLLYDVYARSITT